MTRFHGARRLLNRAPFHSTAAICAEVEDTATWKPNGRDRNGNRIKDADDLWQLQPETILAISNCDRTIRIEVDWETKAGRKNTLHKIDALIETLQEFREGVVIEQARYAERKKAVKR